ncbi:hypothetical protein HK104_003343 [Borealophlyctis nickersoniae]|nr:hypothetical protein HK104_003343 [Borealophlyctis nickersoniae]
MYVVSFRVCSRQELGSLKLLGQAPNEVVILVDLPGVKKEEVNIEAEEEQLTVSGKRHEAKECLKECFNIETAQPRQKERFSGDFKKTVRIPADTKLEDVTAKYENGLLIVRIPKAPEAAEKRKKISIE